MRTRAGCGTRLIVLGLLVLVVVGYCVVQESNLVSPTPVDTQPARSAPTPTDRSAEIIRLEESSQFIWSDQWAEFTQEPMVCNGVLKFRGEVKDGAEIGGATGEHSVFSLYRREDTQVRRGRGFSRVVPPILSFVRPAPAGTFYPALPSGTRVAKWMQAERGKSGFGMESSVPSNVAAEPEQFVLGVWGYRPGVQDYHTLRTAALHPCGEG